MRDQHRCEDVCSGEPTRAVRDPEAQLEHDADREARHRHIRHQSFALLRPVNHGQSQQAGVGRDLVLDVFEVRVRQRKETRIRPDDADGMPIGDDVRADEADGEESQDVEDELPGAREEDPR